MKPILRYQSQLLFRKSYKPGRTFRIRPVKLKFTFRPVGFGLKPKLKSYECKTHCVQVRRHSRTMAHVAFLD
jgi:hypothetical protein